MKIIVATGGTGGHLFPALLTAKTLQTQGHEIFFLGSFSVGEDQIRAKGFDYVNLRARGLVFDGWKKTFGSIVLMGKAVTKSFGILKRSRPDVVIGFGGYGAFPVVLAAKISGIPTLIHEQNVAPGRANALLSKIVDKVAVSFPEAQKSFPKAKVVLTGCPCHQVKTGRPMEELLQFFGFAKKKVTIFVFGGSQGSARINEVFLSLAMELKKERDFQVIHVTGEKDFVKIKEKYAAVQIPVALYKFLDKIEYAYDLADLVIARSGAVTVAELIKAQVASVLIPYPYSYAGHQKQNARVLTRKGSAELIEEKDLNPETLKNAILQMLCRAKRKQDQQVFSRQNGQASAAAQLARETVLLAGKRSKKG